MESRLEVRTQFSGQGWRRAEVNPHAVHTEVEKYGLYSSLRLFWENYLSHNPFHIHSLLFCPSLPTGLCMCLSSQISLEQFAGNTVVSI